VDIQVRKVAYGVIEPKIGVGFCAELNPASAEWFALYDGKDIVGFATILIKGAAGILRYGYISTPYRRKAYRRKAIPLYLYEATLESFRRAGVTRIAAYCNAHSLRILLKRGFVPVFPGTPSTLVSRQLYIEEDTPSTEELKRRQQRERDRQGKRKIDDMMANSLRGNPFRNMGAFAGKSIPSECESCYFGPPGFCDECPLNRKGNHGHQS
jgi:hypothetical protein